VTLPLHPRGTLRMKFAATGAREDVFRRLGIGARKCDLGDEGLYLAEELVEADRWLGGSDPETLAILVLALMIAQRQGSSRLPLDPKGALRDTVRDIMRVAGMEPDARTMKKIVALTASPSFGSVIGIGEARKPLVVEDDCLYTERMRWLEDRVAKRIAARLAAVRREPVDVSAACTGLSAEQARAVALAVGSRFAIVTGGPGTGKTQVAAAIVQAFAQLGVTQIALAAQTGKAAHRLGEVIAARTQNADPPAAQTLHRLLGYHGSGFAHHANNPLPVGALIVDEASMIDLQVMDALLDALPEGAPLVLIGDAHQLPAIDAGQILADLARPDGVAREHVAFLEHSYRMDADDPRGKMILEAAASVRGGGAGRLWEGRLRTPGTLSFSGVEVVDVAASDRPQDATLAVVDAFHHHSDGPAAQRIADRTVFGFVDGHVIPAQEAQLEALWAQLQRARILAVTRGQPTGSVAINEHLHARALDRMTVTGSPDFVPGEPVMITQNDYHRGLFNGDQGIVVRADEGLGKHHYRAVFRVGGRLVPFAIEALRDRLELAWAITVHKSQGSEVDAACVILPHEDLPLVTRELLYTAITRARTSVTIAGTKPVLAAAGKRDALRHSGLARRIQATLAK
jgi:exodeoxyribonuclease V alpha subunit